MKYKKIVFIFITAIILFVLIMYYFIYEYNKNSTYDTASLNEHRLEWYIDDLIGNYKIQSSNRKVKIAVIDSGINFKNENLSLCNGGSACVSEVDQNNNTDFEHGTMVAGIIAAYPHNDKGVRGINPNVKLISIDISDNDGLTNINGLIEAIQIAIDDNVDIINMSLGVDNNDSRLKNIINKAYKNGIIIVAAAGNESTDKILYPAKYKNVIAVGAYSKSGKKMYGKSDKIVYAPGEHIVTTYSTKESDTDYTGETGTSLATPMVTGMISIILQHTNATQKEIYNYYSNLTKVENINKTLSNFRLTD